MITPDLERPTMFSTLLVANRGDLPGAISGKVGYQNPGP